ncbi:MAG: TetR/AcrR family transcriptional regulator [Microthrixaceae bacterium]|nr:TetR/AcrR family transcriptional regulator [Microthrixaceae bacterium]
MTRGRRGRPRNAPSRADRRDELLAAAITAIRRDGANISMARIAAEARITKPVVYAHFGDRAGLAAALAGHIADDLMVRIADSLEGAVGLESTVRSTLATFVDFADRDPELFAFLLDAGGSRSADAEIHSLVGTFAAYIEPAAGIELGARGLSPPEVTLRVRAILGLAYTTVAWWRRDGRDEFTAHGIVERLTSLVMAIFAVP